MMRSRIPSYVGSVCTAVLLSMPASAADVKQTLSSSSVDAPAIGYVVRTPDSSTGVPELRAMLGIPGAARFSDPIALPEGTTAADVAPNHGWVLAIRGTEALAFQPISNTATSIARLGTPSAWAFSPSGTRVALFYADRGNVVVMSGLPGTPKLESTLRFAQLDSFAIGDNGAFVYAAGDRIMNSDGGLVYQASGPMAFEPGRDVLVVYDGANSNLVETAVAGASSRIIAGSVDAMDRLFAGSDRVYAGNSTAGTLSSIDYSSGLIVTQNVAVSRISPSSIQGTVLVSAEADGPAWLVNAQGVSFVPAVVSQQQGIQQ